MTTLAEIEKAIEALPDADKRQLVVTLARRIGDGEFVRRTSPATPDVNSPTMFDIAAGDRIVAEMQKTFTLRRFGDPDGPAASPEEWDALHDESNEDGGGGGA